MKKSYTFDELLHKAASYCSISEHCAYDLYEKLKAWEVDTKQADEIVQHLIDENFLNEERFAVAFVRDKFRFNKWGKIKIKYALRQKKIENVLVDKALNAIDDGEYEEMLASILQSKLKTLKWEYEYEKMGKLFNFAQNRGFESSVIDRVIRQM